MLLGIMLFFAASVAPTVFKTLPAEHAGVFLRKIFPVYYVWGIIIASITAVIAYNTDTAIFTLSTTIAILFVLTRQVLLPVINEARDGKIAGAPGAAVQFKRLHLVSVMINLTQMVLLFIVAAVLMTQL
jgi:hypothetical protein